jgi:tRNA pseudouridine38-40 synthase
LRIALGIEYDGAPFCGWQTQPGGGSAQDALQGALARFADTGIEVVAAGRTDARVHATAQVVHFDAPVARAMPSWVRGTNTYLPPALRVLWACEVADDFHARYSAKARTYDYLLLNEGVAPAVLHGKVGWYHRRLDLERMRAAASLVEGEHDFSAFRDAQCQAKTPVRLLHAARITLSGNLFQFRFTANAFLHHMVRNLVGSLVQVGAGKQPPQWMGELLATRDRRHAAPTFAPDGLYLSGIDYDARFGLPRFRVAPQLLREHD